MQLIEEQVYSDKRWIKFKNMRLIVLICQFVTIVVYIIAGIWTIIFQIKLRKEDANIYGDVYNFWDSYFIFYQIIGILAIIFIIIGIIGIKKNSLLTLELVMGCNTLVIMLFMFGFVVTLFEFNFFKISLFSPGSWQFEDLYDEAAENLCQEGCECYFSGIISEDQIGYVVNYSATDNTLPIGFGQCPQSEGSSQTLINELQNIEAFYECSGWNTFYPIQYFNNVNVKIAPQTSCTLEMVKYWGRFLNFDILLFEIVFPVNLILLILESIFHCYLDEKEKEKLKYEFETQLGTLIV